MELCHTWWRDSFTRVASNHVSMFIRVIKAQDHKHWRDIIDISDMYTPSIKHRFWNYEPKKFTQTLPQVSNMGSLCSNCGLCIYPQVYQWWKQAKRVPYPSTLYVTLKGVQPPKSVDPSLRSMFAIQQVCGLSYRLHHSMTSFHWLWTNWNQRE